MEESSTILKWVFEQGAFVAALLLAIWWLSRKYESVDKKKDDLAEKVVELTVLWQERSETDNSKDAEIKALLIEIRDICKHGK